MYVGYIIFIIIIFIWPTTVYNMQNENLFERITGGGKEGGCCTMCGRTATRSLPYNIYFLFISSTHTTQHCVRRGSSIAFFIILFFDGIFFSLTAFDGDAIWCRPFCSHARIIYIIIIHSLDLKPISTAVYAGIRFL